MRLFVAIEFDERVKSVLDNVQTGLGKLCDGVRWIPPHQLHVTVKFLGEVPDPAVNEVAEAVARSAAKAAPFTMEVAGCGCFPPHGAVRIVWTGLQEPSGVLLQGAEAVESELEQIGFKRERRPISPHVTIGRVREDRSHGRIRSAVEAFTFDSVEQSVGSLTLMSSVLSPQGPTYTPVSKTALG